MITTFIIAVVTVASALGLTGLAGLCVDNVDRRWQRRGEPARLDLSDRTKRQALGGR